MAANVDLVEAAVHAFSRPLHATQSHQNIEVAGLYEFVLALRKRFRDEAGRKEPVSTEQYESLFEEISRGTAEVAGIGADRTAVVRAIIEQQQPIFVRDERGIRLSERERLPNLAMFSGLDLVGAVSPDMVRRMLASNYLLVFPEALSVLRAFAPPGSTKANARRQADRFRFCRKLNDTNVTYCINELEVLGAVRPHRDGLVATSPPPPSAAAHFVLEAALEITGYKLDTQIPTNLLAQQLIDRLPAAESIVRAGNLHLQLGAPEPLLKQELAGAQVRVTRSAFQWMARQGIADPLWVGAVLKAEGSKDAVSALGRAIMSKVNSLKPTNIDEYLAVFAEAT